MKAILFGLILSVSAFAVRPSVLSANPCWPEVCPLSGVKKVPAKAKLQPKKAAPAAKPAAPAKKK